MNPAFTVARETAGNFQQSFQKVKDENAIESILAQASQSEDPKVLQDTIGKILSQVSPERQGPAIKYLESIYSRVEENKKLKREQEAAAQGGYTYGAPPQVAAAQVKEKAKGGRLAQYGLGKEQLNAEQIGRVDQPSSILTRNPIISATGQPPSNQAPETVFKRLSDDQLVVATGAPDREVSEPAKAELKRRETEKQTAKGQYEPEAEKLEAKRVAALSDEIENDYKAATNEDLRLDRMVVLDKEKNVSAPTLIKVLDTFGLPIGILSNPATEEFRKLEADFIRDVSKVFPGGKITNYELQSYLRTIPGLMNSPEGRKEIIRNRKLMNEAKRIRYDEYKTIIKENGGKKPQNLGILLDERTLSKITNIEDRFREGIEKNVDKFQTPLRMYDPQGNAIDVPPNEVDRAMKAGAKFK